MDESVPSRAAFASSVNLIVQSLCFQLASSADFKAVTHYFFAELGPKEKVKQNNAQKNSLRR